MFGSKNLILGHFHHCQFQEARIAQLLDCDVRRHQPRAGERAGGPHRRQRTPHCHPRGAVHLQGRHRAAVHG